jgi:hypothetical protein
MNVDPMLRVLNEEQVDYLLIGGMNFLIRHLCPNEQKPRRMEVLREAIRRSETQ